MRSFFQCNFCRLDLKRLSFSRLRFTDRLLMFLGLPVYQCPHCFGCSRKPWIPRWLLTLTAAGTAGETSTETVTDDDCGPITIPLTARVAQEQAAHLAATAGHTDEARPRRESPSIPTVPTTVPTTVPSSVSNHGSLTASALLEQA